MSPMFKFNKPGRWADPNPRLPQIQVDEEGDKHPVTSELAKVLVDAGHGEIVDEPEGDEEEELDETSAVDAADAADAAGETPEEKKAEGPLKRLRRRAGRRGAKTGPVEKSEVLN